MKKVISILLALILVLSLVACGGEKSNSDDSSKSAKSSYSNNTKSVSDLTDQEIKSKVAEALQSQVKSIFSKAEPSLTRFNITNKENKNDKLYVYGTLSLFDKYGESTYPYRQKFELIIDEYGKISYNNVKIRD